MAIKTYKGIAGSSFYDKQGICHRFDITGKLATDSPAVQVELDVMVKAGAIEAATAPEAKAPL